MCIALYRSIYYCKGGFGSTTIKGRRKERRKQIEMDDPWPQWRNLLYLLTKYKKNQNQLGTQKCWGVRRKSNLYIYNKHLTDIVCTIPPSTDSQLYLYVWQPRSENVPYFGYSLLDYNCCMFVWLGISQKHFSIQIICQKVGFVVHKKRQLC